MCGRVIPVRTNAKAPIVPHKGGVWTDELCDAFFTDKQRSEYRTGMILYNLILLDFDGVEDDKKKLLEHGEVKYKAWCKQFPELEEAPTERTKKGMHVYLWRSAGVDAAGLSDTALQFPSTGERCCIDLKTRTSSVVKGHLTGGLVVCSPTKNYTWMVGRSIFDIMPPEPSEALIQHIATMMPAKARKLKTASKPGRVKPLSESGIPDSGMPDAGMPDADEVNVMDIAGIACRREDDTICLRPIEDMDTLDVRHMASRRLDICTLPVSVRDDGRRFQSFSVNGACPFCGNVTAEGKAHNNNFYHYVNINGVRVVKAFPASGCKGNGIKESGIRIEYRAESLAAYQDAFDKSVSACARELSAAETKRVLSLIRPSCRGKVYERGFDSADGGARAWWDSAGCGRLYVRLPRNLAAPVHYAVVSSMCGFAGAGLGAENEACRIAFTKTPWVPSVIPGERPNVLEPIGASTTMSTPRSNRMRSVIVSDG